MIYISLEYYELLYMTSLEITRPISIDHLSSYNTYNY